MSDHSQETRSTGTLELNGLANLHINSIDIEDGVLFLHIEAKTGHMVIGYDLTSGAEVSRILLGSSP